MDDGDFREFAETFFLKIEEQKNLFRTPCRFKCNITKSNIKSKTFYYLK